ncbi:hypothetical protein ABM34_06785 [Companilactobacillus ginsenosidimutans]|uniref:Uncharacterized protein n=1 Tax=Companilactobacillus ginsenosidimutans TaxID=1007676 RepID=A0A0H4QKM3_9LACO|nr:hypothetical protein ABM34_06785 [Companilactobacillus ginsenosidimutans]
MINNTTSLINADIRRSLMRLVFCEIFDMNFINFENKKRAEAYHKPLLLGICKLRDYHEPLLQKLRRNTSENYELKGVH